jgi:hypothetical protein
MPEPRDGEKQTAFISRCVKQVMGEGKEQKAALGECYGIWRQKHPTNKLFLDVYKQTVQGVHQQTAIGNENDRKRRSFNAVVATQSVSTKRPDVEERDPDENEEAEQDIVRGVKPNGKQWAATVDIKKADPEQRIVGGWASVASLDGERIIDKQGDIIPVEELERAVIDYVLNSRDGGDMHNRRGVSKLAASIVFTPEKEKLGLTAKDEQGRTIHGWWTEFKVHDDDLWAAFKRGERPELSIGGQAFPVEIEGKH